MLRPANPRLLRSEEERRGVKQALFAFYRNRPEHYSTGDTDLGRSYVEIVARFAEVGGRVLDLGPGSWRNPFLLFQHGYDVDACDVWSEDYLATQLGLLPATGPRLTRYDGDDLPYADQTFDCVCSHTVMEHLLDVEHALSEAHRVLRPGGVHVIVCPNWSSPSSLIRAIQYLLFKHRRYWRYETYGDALAGVFRSLLWPLKARVSAGTPFLYVYPRMAGGQIHFESSDDDAVHLCCPASFKRWFRRPDCRMLAYNRGYGRSRAARLFNTLFPSWATTNVIVVRKTV